MTHRTTLSIEALLEALAKELTPCSVQVTHHRRGPYRELHRFLLKISCQGREYRMGLTAFLGRPPHYRPWVELHDWDPGLYREGHLTPLLIALKTVLPPGSLLYLEYIGEPQTRRMLERGSRLEETPLGKALLESGFGSLENLYYPEGYREGHPKIRAQA